MASLFSFSLLFLFLLLSSASSRQPPKSHLSNPTPQIIQACKATRFPDTCHSSLISLPQNPSPIQIIHSAIDSSSANLKTAQSMVKSILDSSAGNANRTTAAKNCIEVLDNSQYRLSSSHNALAFAKTKDARAWMTAALLYQYDCSNALKYANDTSLTNQTMSFLDSLMMLTSNALSMVVSYDLFGNNTGSWSPPKTERNGFWENSGSGVDLVFGGGFPSKLTADVTVCKDGSNACYKTVQEAVNAAPDNGEGRKFVIHIKEGVYDEIVRIPLQKKNVVFLGDGVGKTVITGSLAVGQIGISTYNTATLETNKQPLSPKPRLKFKSLIFIVIGVFCGLCLVASIIFLAPHRKYQRVHSPTSPPANETESPTTPLPQSPKPSPIKALPVADIKLACKATRNPQICQSSLTQPDIVPSNPTPLQIIQSALSLCYNNLTSAQSMLKTILVSEEGNPNITRLAKSCLEIIGYSQHRMSQANDTLPKGDTKNARAWMSAAVAYQYDCYGGLAYHGGNTSEINQTRSYLNTSVTLGSNALSMMISYDLFGNDTSSWKPPRTERDGFWEVTGSSSKMGYESGFPSNLKADATVCKDGSSGCYKSIQEAVNNAPNNTVDKKFVIHIKEGVYDEIVRIVFEKKNVVFIGDGIGKSVITGSLSVAQPGVTTFESATVGVLGDGFMASGLTIQNTAGAPTHQAVAFRSDSDLSFIENCEFIGNQDTLYAHSLRQYYKSCRIQGNVDFIFGNSAAIFEDCEILVSPRLEKPEHGENNAITAHGRTDPAQSTGFVFHNCLINGTQKYMELYHSNPRVHKNYLGRPWKEYSRVVFINCEFEALIAPEGWMPWSGDFALKTLYYGEYENKGAGSNLSQRVKWSSEIPKEHVQTYSVQNFIQGDEWIPTSS